MATDGNRLLVKGGQHWGAHYVKWAARKQPIPVYAEMSSINPVYLLPQAMASRGAAIAAGFVPRRAQ